MENVIFKNIIFFRWKGLGDLLLDTPLFKTIKENFKNVNLKVLTSPSNKEVLIANPYIDEILPQKNFLEITFEKCDLFIDMMGNSMTIFLFFLLRPKYRVGFKKKIPFLNLKIPFNPSPTYTVKHRLELLKLLNIENIPENALPETYLLKEEEDIFKNKFKNLISKSYITIFPYARGKVRDFDPKIFSYLNDKLKEKGFNIYFIFDRMGEKKILEIKKLCKIQPEFIFSPTLRELIFLLKYSKLYIGPDTGPKHIAVSQKTKTLTFFTHTNPLNWTPPDFENNKFITPSIECHPCETKNLNYCKRKDFKCLTLFEPEKIFEISLELLKK